MPHRNTASVFYIRIDHSFDHRLLCGSHKSQSKYIAIRKKAVDKWKISWWFSARTSSVEFTDLSLKHNAVCKLCEGPVKN